MSKDEKYTVTIKFESERLFGKFELMDKVRHMLGSCGYNYRVNECKGLITVHMIRGFRKR